MIYVYALTDPVEPPDGLRGLNDAPLHMVATGHLGAVYSAAPVPRPETTAEQLWRHETVAEALMEGGPPCRPVSAPPFRGRLGCRRCWSATAR